MSQNVHRQTGTCRSGGLTGPKHIWDWSLAAITPQSLVSRSDSAPTQEGETVLAYIWVMVDVSTPFRWYLKELRYNSHRHASPYVLTCQVSDGIFDNVVPAVWLLSTCWILHTVSPAGIKGRWQVSPQMKSGSLYLVLQLMRAFMSTLISLH